MYIYSNDMDISGFWNRPVDHVLTADRSVTVVYQRRMKILSLYRMRTFSFFCPRRLQNNIYHDSFF